MTLFLVVVQEFVTRDVVILATMANSHVEAAFNIGQEMQYGLFDVLDVIALA